MASVHTATVAVFLTMPMSVATRFWCSRASWTLSVSPSRRARASIRDVAKETKRSTRSARSKITKTFGTAPNAHSTVRGKIKDQKSRLSHELDTFSFMLATLPASGA